MRDAARAMLDFHTIEHNARGKVAGFTRLQAVPFDRHIEDDDNKDAFDEDDVVDFGDPIVDIASEVFVSDLLASMTPTLGRVMTGIARDDLSWSDASNMAGISRFAVRRMADAWARDHEHLLAV
jgi:hypothetical protein